MANFWLQYEVANRLIDHLWAKFGNTKLTRTSSQTDAIRAEMKAWFSANNEEELFLCYMVGTDADWNITSFSLLFEMWFSISKRYCLTLASRPN